MSLDVYLHVIVPDEVDPETLKVLVSGADAALERAPRDAQRHLLKWESPAFAGLSFSRPVSRILHHAPV
jgi:hypothetical protein